MGIASVIRGMFGERRREQVLIGRIVDSPTVKRSDAGSTLSFRLDSQPGLEFQQLIQSIGRDRRAGEQVKVRYHLDGGGVAVVDSIERA